MTYKFTICTRGGRLDSLKQPVSVAFTLTPVDAGQSQPSCGPVVCEALKFDSNSEEKKSFEYDLDLAFGTYKTETWFEKPWCSTIGSITRGLRSGQSMTITSRPSVGARWDCPKHENDFLVAAVNNTESEQSLALLVKCRDSTYYPVLAYQPLRKGKRVSASPRLMLQVYVPKTRSCRGSILRAEDLECPLFETPLDCEALPKISSWRLSQDTSGSFRLQGDHEVEPDSIAPTEVLMGSTELGSRNQRTWTRDTVDLSNGDLLAMKESLSILHRHVADLDRQVPIVEAKADKAGKAFDDTLDNLSAMHKFLQTTQQQVIMLHRKVPAAEAKTEKLASSFGQTQEELSSIRLSLATISEHLNSLDRKVAGADAKADKVAEALDQIKDYGVPEAINYPAAIPYHSFDTSIGSPTSFEAPRLPLPSSLEE